MKTLICSVLAGLLLGGPVYGTSGDSSKDQKSDKLASQASTATESDVFVFATFVSLNKRAKEVTLKNDEGQVIKWPVSGQSAKALRVAKSGDRIAIRIKGGFAALAPDIANTSPGERHAKAQAAVPPATNLSFQSATAEQCHCTRAVQGALSCAGSCVGVCISGFTCQTIAGSFGFHCGCCAVGRIC